MQEEVIMELKEYCKKIGFKNMKQSARLVSNAIGKEMPYTTFRAYACGARKMRWETAVLISRWSGGAVSMADLGYDMDAVE